MPAKLLFLIVICSYQVGRSQSVSTLMGARAMGIGFTSSTLTDDWSMFNNVGGLGKVNHSSVNFACELNPALPGANRTAASVLASTKIGTIGLGVFRFGDDLYSEHLFSLGFGNSIGNTSLGGKINYVQYRASEGFGTRSAASFDFGGVTAITRQISVGAYITNLTQAKLNSSEEHLPTKMVTGIGFKPTEKIMLAAEVEKDLGYQATVRAGLEYTFLHKVFFRTGFNMNPNAAFFGLGILKKNLKIDYAIRFNQLLGAGHQASAVYQIPSKLKK